MWTDSWRFSLRSKCRTPSSGESTVRFFAENQMVAFHSSIFQTVTKIHHNRIRSFVAGNRMECERESRMTRKESQLEMCVPLLRTRHSTIVGVFSGVLSSLEVQRERMREETPHERKQNNSNGELRTDWFTSIL